MNTKFFRCPVCGNIVTVLNEGGGPLSCCGKPMLELKANITDAATEKHVPVVTINGANVDVKVGTVPHPMTPEHYIQWICLETTTGIKIAKLLPSNKPEAQFVLADGEKAIVAYEYCNLHGLWSATL